MAHFLLTITFLRICGENIVLIHFEYLKLKKKKSNSSTLPFDMLLNIACLVMPPRILNFFYATTGNTIAVVPAA